MASPSRSNKPPSPSASPFLVSVSVSASHSRPSSAPAPAPSRSRSRSSSTATTASVVRYQKPKHPRAASHKSSQHSMLHSDSLPPSPLILTSALAPPCLSAAGISASSSPSSSKKSSRKPGATLTLSMLPPHVSSPTIAPSNPAAYTLHQSYAHSLSAQQLLQLHQKEIITQATRATGIPAHLLSTGPMSPRLIPLGSPGPVTPLTLEENSGGYMFAGSAETPLSMEQQQLQQRLAILAARDGGQS